MSDSHHLSSSLLLECAAISIQLFIDPKINLKSILKKTISFTSSNFEMMVFWGWRETENYLYYNRKTFLSLDFQGCCQNKGFWEIVEIGQIFYRRMDAILTSITLCNTRYIAFWGTRKFTTKVLFGFRKYVLWMSNLTEQITCNLINNYN